ncbi:MAG: gliding-associated putative ABC transporter substrate-binding component GldG [Rhodothermales bacterium]|jgi:gliding-associated putative ABC transporter substrate-binding component GldG
MKRDWTSRSTILLIGLILVVVNLIGLNLFGRVDLTDDGVYSLSDASKDLIQNLEDPVTVTAFFTANLPAPYGSNRRFLKDKLDDYRAYGGQNFQYRFVDPAEDEDQRADAERMGIPAVQIQVIEADNVQLKNAYMGVAIEYGGNRETVPVLQNLSTLEYDITGAVRRLTRDRQPQVGFLTGHGEPAPATDMQSLNQGLQRNYEVVTVAAQGGSLSAEPDVLVVAAPADSLSPETQLALDAYVMGGGRLALLLNRVDADLQSGQAAARSVGLERMLASYGIGLRENLIMDKQSSPVTVQRQQGFFSVAQQIEYPFFPVATSFGKDNMMVSRLRDMMFYYVSEVDTSLALPTGVEREDLIFSSAQSAQQQGFFMIQPMGQQFPLEDGPFVLGSAYTGSFPSAFEPGRQSVSTRMVLVGDGDFVNESVVGANQGNISFALNMVDWLVQDDAMLSIRAKSVAPRALSSVSDGMRPWIKYGTMLGPVLLVILFGLLRWRRRQTRQILLVRS